MVQVKVLQSNNDIGLESTVNAELQALTETGKIIIGVQFQHTAIVMGESTRPSFAAMISYDVPEDTNIDYEEEFIDVRVQRD